MKKFWLGCLAGSAIALVVSLILFFSLNRNVYVQVHFPVDSPLIFTSVNPDDFLGIYNGLYGKKILILSHFFLVLTFL